MRSPDGRPQLRPGRMGRAIRFSLAATFTLLGGELSAGVLDPLQGAWGASGTSCEQVFSVNNGKMNLKRDGFGVSGFIVSGKRFEGPNATCSLISSQEKGDTVTLALDCRMQVIFDTAIVSVRMLDADTLVRFNPDFPELDMRYVRCKP